MNIFVVGASGRTGRHVVTDALRRGHAVTTLVRSQSSFPAHSQFRVVTGDPRDRGALVASLENQDAVISCLGHRTAADATLLADSARSLIGAMSEQGGRRLVVISQGLLFPGGGIIVSVLRVLLARHVADSRAMEELVSRSELHWTIVRPPYLTERRTPRGYRVTPEAMPARSFTLARVDLAAGMLDEVDTHPHPRAVVGIASR